MELFYILLYIVLNSESGCSKTKAKKLKTAKLKKQDEIPMHLY